MHSNQRQMSQSSESDKPTAVMCDVSEQSAAVESGAPPEPVLSCSETTMSEIAPVPEHIVRVYSRWVPVTDSEVFKEVPPTAADQ